MEISIPRVRIQLTVIERLDEILSLVEILIRLLETDVYINNTVETSWLDGLIAEHFQTEKPDILLSIVCCAIHIADETFRNSFQNFQTSLER